MQNMIHFTKGCAKLMLLTLNGFCILVALCTFAFAIVDTRVLKQYGVEHASGTLVGDMIMIAACLLLLGVAVFGIVGAVRESAKILYLLVALCTFAFAIVDTRVLKQYGVEHASGTLVGDMIMIAACLLLLGVAVFGIVGAVRESAKILYLLVALCTFAFAIVDTRVLKQYGVEHASGTLVGDMIMIAACLLLLGVAVFGIVGAVRESAKILYLLVALCTFAFAIVDTRVLKQYGVEHASGTLVGDMIMIAACLLLLGVAVFGIVGAVRESAKILYLYVGLLMILVVLELLVGIYVALQRYGLEFRITEWLRDDFFRNATGDHLMLHEKLWDDMQMKYECCGLNGPEDYQATQRDISLSCCPRAYRARTDMAQKQLYGACIDSGTYFSEGCEDEILLLLRSDANWLLGVAFMSFWFEAAGMLLSMYVANNLRNSVNVYKETVKY